MQVRPKALLRDQYIFDFIPIDISQQAIDDLVHNMQDELTTLSVKPIVGDYFEVLANVVKDDRPHLLLFLGSNIGNFEYGAAKDMLGQLHAILNPDDHCLIGFDLKKNPNIIRAAYNDSRGVTKAFNLNLLIRINRELRADFRTDQFDFYAYYNPIGGDVRSFIVSLTDQQVNIAGIGCTFEFSQGEVICTELSKKYSLDDIEQLARDVGFAAPKHFLDDQLYFVDSLWRCAK